MSRTVFCPSYRRNSCSAGELGEGFLRLGWGEEKFVARGESFWRQTPAINPLPWVDVAQAPAILPRTRWADHSLRSRFEIVRVSQTPCSFVDIHCHVLPRIDDGAADLEAALAMARMAVDDGIGVIIATPHQLGNFGFNRGDLIRQRVREFQCELNNASIPLQVLPGADVRIEDGMLDLLASGEVLTLADLGRHVLLELPHELYFPLDGLVDHLARRGMTGVLSHPERNAGLLRRPELLAPLVDGGCLMQVTAGSLVGTFGPESQRLAEWMLAHGLVHFIATDAHSPRNRRPLLRRAFERVAEFVDEATAHLLCCEYPSRVAQGADVPEGRVAGRPPRTWRTLFSGRKAA